MEKYCEQEMHDAPIIISSGNPLSDELLFERYSKCKNTAELEILIQRYQGLAFRVALSVCGNRALAEEAVQDAFVQLPDHAKNFKSRGGGSFRAWFYPFMLHVAQHCARSERRIQMREHNFRNQEAVRTHLLPDTDVCRQTEQQVQMHALRDAIFELSIDLRIPIILHFLEEMPQWEVGKILGINQSQVSRRLTQGLDILRKRLTSAGASFSLVALPGMLQGLPDFQIPSGMGNRIAANVCGFQATSQHVVSYKKTVDFARRGLLGATCVLVGVVVAGWFLMAQIPNRHVEGSGSSKNTTAREIHTPDHDLERPLCRIWNFNDPNNLHDLQIQEGKWHHVADGGPDHSGCMETDTDQLLLRINVPLKRFPVRVTYSYRPLPMPGIETYQSGLCWEHFAWGAYFHNAGRPLGAISSQWRQAEYFVGERLFDKWEAGRRYNLNAYHRMAGCHELVLRLEGPFRIDNIKIEEVSADEIPDVTPFTAELDRFGESERRGSHQRPSLPAGDPGKTVTLVFFAGEPLDRRFVP